MRPIVKQILATAAVAATLSASPAFAQFDPASGGTGNSSLVLSVFDTELGISLFQDLGLNYLDFQNSPISRDGTPGTDVTPDSGLVLNFQADLSLFANSAAGNIRYTVFAADGQGAATTTAALVTAAPGLASIPGTNGDITGMYGSQAYANLIGQCAAQGMSSVCTGTNFGAQGVYVGGTDWGDNFQFMDVPGSTTVGSSLGFYGLNRTSVGSTAALASYAYANSAGTVATWLLDASGLLTWNSQSVGSTVVPLPAAVWLLLSGLGGLGIISRRRSGAPVAA